MFESRRVRQFFQASAAALAGSPPMPDPGSVQSVLGCGPGFTRVVVADHAAAPMNEFQHINEGIGLVIGLVFPVILVVLIVAYWWKTRDKGGGD